MLEPFNRLTLLIDIFHFACLQDYAIFFYQNISHGNNTEGFFLVTFLYGSMSMVHDVISEQSIPRVICVGLLEK